MDDFPVERPEINGALLSFEFGSGGKIHQIWAADPADREGGEEYPFVLAPMQLAEEFSEDYFPGSILIGARTRPDDPWVVSRNIDASLMEELDDPSQVAFEYEFSLLPEIGATGRFYEVLTPIPHVVWDVRIENIGRVSLEIGELAFPMAFNNHYEGFPRNKEGRRALMENRVAIHKSIAGAASFVHVQRLNGRPPGLLIVPGDDSSWEFFASVASTLKGPDSWPGIPVVYAHSKATVERERWTTWFTDNSSMIMEPGDVKNYRTKFIPTDAADAEAAMATLAACGHPTISLFPGAVAPVDVGAIVQISGTTPTQVFSDREALLEAESEEGRGSCAVSPIKTGPLRFSFEDSHGRQSHAHLLFIEPIEDKIKARADWICRNQVVTEGPLKGAIVMADIDAKQMLSELEEFSTPFALESSLGDALFLAGKNAIYPDAAQIEILETYLNDFIPRCIQNPASGLVGFSFEGEVPRAINTGWPRVYSLLSELQWVVGSLFPDGSLEREKYGTSSMKSADAFVEHLLPQVAGESTSVFQERLIDRLRQRRDRRLRAPIDLPKLDLPLDQGNASLTVEERARELRDRLRSTRASVKLPQFRDLSSSLLLGPEPLPGPLDANGVEGFASLAQSQWPREITRQSSFSSQISTGYAQRSLSPHWWWYGSDIRVLPDLQLRNRAMMDRGELCLGFTTPNNACLGLQQLEHDAISLNPGYLRMAFGGLLGVWALVQPDGSASAGFCPDPSSDQFGMSSVTGDIGIALYAYLLRAASYVVPAADFAFGCRFEMDEEWAIVTPWDGIGRKIVVGSYGIKVEAQVGRIRRLRFKLDRSEAVVEIENPAETARTLSFTFFGLWGETSVGEGVRLAEYEHGVPGEVRVEIECEAKGTVSASLKGDGGNP